MHVDVLGPIRMRNLSAEQTFSRVLMAVTIVVVGLLGALHWSVARDRAAAVALRQILAAARESTLERPPNIDMLRGHWVWTREVAAGTTRRAIASSDMIMAVGPRGWRGCPAQYVCTRYGIRALVIGEQGRFHEIHNVFTSSDFQYDGVLVLASPGVAQLALLHHYSCAHPSVVGDDRETRYVRFALRHDELWLGVDHLPGAELGYPSTPPRGEPTNWLVWRRVTRSEFYRKYLLRRCQPTPETPECDPGCFDDALGE